MRLDAAKLSSVSWGAMTFARGVGGPSDLNDGRLFDHACVVSSGETPAFRQFDASGNAAHRAGAISQRFWIAMSRDPAR